MDHQISLSDSRRTSGLQVLNRPRLSSLLGCLGLEELRRDQSCKGQNFRAGCGVTRLFWFLTYSAFLPAAAPWPTVLLAKELVGGTNRTEYNKQCN